MNIKNIFKDEKVFLTLISFIGVLLSLILTLVAAIQSNAIVLWSEFYSFCVDSVLLYFSFIVASLNKKNNRLIFNFGLGKVESFAGIVLSVLMLFYAILIIYMVSIRIMHPIALQNVKFGLILYCFFMVKDLYLWRRLNRFIKYNQSPLIISQRRYYQLSIVTNCIVMLPLIMAILLPHPAAIAMTIDILASLVICFITVYLSFNAGKKAAYDLIDTALEESTQLEILRYMAKHFNLYEQYHGELTRQSGRSKYIDIFLEFDEKKSIGQVLNDIDTIQDDIQNHIPNSYVHIIPTKYKYGQKALGPTKKI